jgi:hypothetical protein
VADRPPVQRTIQMEYRFDRLLSEKLVQAYELLIPEKRWPTSSVSTVESGTRQEGVNEESGRHIRARFF